MVLFVCVGSVLSILVQWVVVCVLGVCFLLCRQEIDGCVMVMLVDIVYFMVVLVLVLIYCFVVESNFLVWDVR